MNIADQPTDPDPTAPDADERPAHWAPSVTAAAVVTDPDEIAAIRARVAESHHRELTPWWARVAQWIDSRPSRATTAVERKP